MPSLVLRTSRALLVVTIVGVTYLSLTPAPPATPGGFDKANHVIAYAALAFLLVLSVRRPPNRLVRLLGLVAVTVAYGVAMEIIQRYTGRDLDPMDVAANTIGATIGVAGGLLARRWFSHRSSRSDS